jgi:phosphoribosylglycinamide formyltransferase-1
VLANDTEETLSARILEQEHIAYSEAIQKIVSGQCTIDGRCVRLK